MNDNIMIRHASAETLNTAIALLDASLLIMNDGGKHWYQGGYYKSTMPVDDGKYAYCTVGGLRMADRGHSLGSEDDWAGETPFSIVQIALYAVVPLMPDGDQSITRYNDEPTTTWADIVKLHEDAKALLRKRLEEVGNA